jgi:uncharacterized protein (DUF427 family)
MLVPMADVERIEPGPGQESVWDYPRPPALSPTDRRVRVLAPDGGPVLAESTRAVRVLETSQAPAVYLPPEDVTWMHLVPSARRTFCEWKGTAEYFDVVVGGRAVVDGAAWRYPEPTAPFATLAGWVSFYPSKVECRLDDEVVAPMPGGFYGGWVTSDVVGPFKGAPGTLHW